MIEIVRGTLVFIARVVNFALDVAIFIANAKYLSRVVTGSDKHVEVPPDPKPLPPAAQRALAEAKERERREVSCR
jgi:hypothetical protein